MRDMLFALLGLLAAGAAGFFFYRFQNSADDSTNLILGIVCTLVAIGFGAFFMFSRVNRHDDIHVTE